MNATKKIVIIGSGISGLVCGAVLSKHGYEVTLLEKNHQLGGALQVFSRDKIIFDTAVHYIGSLDDGETLYQLFKYLEILDQLHLVRLDEHGYDCVRLHDGFSVKHGMGYHNFKKELLASFPDSSEEIGQICNELQLFCTYFPLYNLEMDAAINYVRNPEILAVGAWEKMETLTQNKRLIQAILGSGPLYCGIKGKTPFYVVALILNSFIKGSYRLSTGSSSLVKALVKVIRQHGGHVHRRKEVSSVCTNENGEISKVLCADGSNYETNYVVSSMHPSETIRVIGSDLFRPAFPKRINSLENTIAPFMLYVGFEKGKVPIENSNFYDYFTENIWEDEYHFHDSWPQMTFTSFHHGKHQVDYADSCSMMCYLDINSFAEWLQVERTIVNQNERCDEYYRFKSSCEALVLKRFKERFPDYAECIKSVYSSSPLTYRDFLNTPNGSMYGIQKDFNKILHSQINTRTHIPNLFLTGQNTLFHGILGASLASLITCFQFIDKKKLVDKIKNA